MSYIGNSPAPFFTAVTTDVFSANGTGTDFTLSRRISNLADIEVIVDNIQQNPFSGSYSVSGDTLSFSSAPSSGSNNVIVTYRQATIGSTIPTPNTVGNNALRSDLSLTGNTTTQHILPAANVTYDIGSDTMRYRDLYLSGNTIQLGAVSLSTSNETFVVANTTGGVLPSELGNTTITGSLITSDAITVGNTTVNTIIHSTGITANGAGIHGVNAASVGGNTASDLRNYSANASNISSGSLNVDRISNSSITSGKLASNTANENIGYVPVNKAGDTLTGDLTTVGINCSSDLSLYRNDGFDSSIVMPSSMDSRSLYFQRQGGGNLNHVRFNTSTVTVNGSLDTIHKTVANFYQANKMPDSVSMGSWHGLRGYMLEVSNPTPSGVSNKIVLQRSTDWNDWNSEGMLITFQANGYSGGGIYVYYWRLGYYNNSLVQLFGAGQSISSSAITINGPYDVAGAPSDCKYFDLLINQGAYEYSSIMVNTNLSPVSSITYYRQFRLRNG